MYGQKDALSFVSEEEFREVVKSLTPEQRKRYGVELPREDKKEPEYLDVVLSPWLIVAIAFGIFVLGLLIGTGIVSKG